jgi:hypothetical protein
MFPTNGQPQGKFRQIAQKQADQRLVRTASNEPRLPMKEGSVHRQGHVQDIEAVQISTAAKGHIDVEPMQQPERRSRRNTEKNTAGPALQGR